MSAAEAPLCAQAIGDETLAAWRDGFLRSSSAVERLRAHTSTCASCQRRLAAMESLGTVLRRQRVPEPYPALWRRIEARMSVAAHRYSARVVWGGAAAVAAVLLIALSFLTLFSTVRPPGAPSTIPTRQITASATPTSTLDWRSGSLPADFATQPQQPWLAVAPSDGRIAYTCLLTPVAGGTRPAIWRTDDRAATWTRVGAVPITRSDLLSCTLLLDEGEPAIAVASVSYGAFYANASGHIAHFATYDHGATWEPVADADGTYYEKLITWQKVKFALRNIEPRDQPDQDLRLATSVDNMRSWQRIDTPLKARGLHVTDFWLDDVTGALIVRAGSASSSLQVWRSADQGASWTMIPDQQANLDTYDGGFAQPTGAWSLCAITPADASPLTGRCTIDGGQTWSRFHRQAPEISSSVLPDDLRGLVVQVVFKRDDGAFVLSVMGSDRAMLLLRLDPVSGKWMTLGQIPAAFLRYAPNASGGAGVLWAIPVGGAPGAWHANVQTATVPFQRS
jgi:hypothetical protein